MTVAELVLLLESLGNPGGLVVVWNEHHQQYMPAVGIKTARGLVEVTAVDLTLMS